MQKFSKWPVYLIIIALQLTLKKKKANKFNTAGYVPNTIW